MRFLYPLVFCLLLPSAISAQVPVNDLIISFNSAKTDSQKIAACEQLIKYYSVKNTDSASYYAQLGIDYSRKNLYPAGDAKINILLGKIDQKKGRVDLAKQHMGYALLIYKNINFIPGIADMYGNLGAIEGGKGNYDSAIIYLLNAFKLHSQLKDYKGLVVTCSNLGSLYLQHDDTTNAAKYFMLAEDASKKTPMMDQTISLYNTIGVMYAGRGQKQKSLEYFLNDLKLSDKPGFENSHIEALTYLGEYYIESGDQQKALQYLNEGLKLATANGNPEMQSNVLLDLAVLTKQKDPNAAIGYLRQAQSIALSTQNRAFLINVLGEIEAVYRQKGDYKQALAISDDKQKLADSIYNLSKDKEIAYIAATYQLETNEQIKKLEGLSRHNAAQRNEIVIVAGCLVVVLIVLLFYFLKTKKLNEQSAIHEKQLEELNSMKDKLFSVIGHDLRGPIARIPAMIEIIEDKNTTPEETKFLFENLKEQTKVSLETFDKLLYWGRLLVKGIRLQQQTIHPKTFIKESIELRKIKTGEKNITITDNTPPDLTIFSDASIFDFIVRNLLANALKYTPRNGSIEINPDTITRPGYTVFGVKDSGMGIGKSRMQNIFYMLTSQDGTDNEKGNGIGLMLCKEFAIQNGGDIWVESEPGKGAVFYFSVKTEA